MTNSTAKLSAGALNRGDVLTACFRDIQSQSNGVCNYYDFIRREGLSLSIWFDIVEFRENIHMTVKIFANVHQRTDVFGTKARMDTYRIIIV